MKVHREIAPALHPLAPPSLLPYRQETTGNGLPVIYLHDPRQEMFKIDLVLPHGAYHQPRPLVASTTINLLNAGTRALEAAGIADFFDFHGASVETRAGVHRSGISLLSPRRHAAKMIEMLATMLLDSTFPRRELEIHARNGRQAHEDDMEKTSYLARRAFLRLLHGEGHPYANHFTTADFDRVTVEDARAFHRSRLSAPACRLILSGNVDDDLPRVIERAFSPLPREPLAPDGEIPLAPATPGVYRFEKPGAVQASLRVGKRGVRLEDDDYIPFQLLNMALGGYFGSRLVSNIREDKGYTYGIYSMNVNLALGAYWMISTEVNASQADAALDEIRREIARLQEEPIPDEEMRLVKSYDHGELLRELDGTFAQAEALKHDLDYGTDTSFCTRALERARDCTPETLLSLAREHLRLDEMLSVIVG
jgi:predicted Zn-dependent peptidase